MRLRYTASLRPTTLPPIAPPPIAILKLMRRLIIRRPVSHCTRTREPAGLFGSSGNGICQCVVAQPGDGERTQPVYVDRGSVLVRARLGRRSGCRAGLSRVYSRRVPIRARATRGRRCYPTCVPNSVGATATRWAKNPTGPVRRGRLLQLVGSFATLARYSASPLHLRRLPVVPRAGGLLRISRQRPMALFRLRQTRRPARIRRSTPGQFDDASKSRVL